MQQQVNVNAKVTWEVSSVKDVRLIITTLLMDVDVSTVFNVRIT